MWSPAPTKSQEDKIGFSFQFFALQLTIQPKKIPSKIHFLMKKNTHPNFCNYKVFKLHRQTKNVIKGAVNNVLSIKWNID